ncbi:MAG: hypothetical protein K2K58_10090 [Muribaculaceae bacterium]|nr:hypothetical protein [Muribaculaceae bacterium]
MKFYTYGNIVRILRLDKENPTNSLMIDVNMDEEKILSRFDASRPFDAAFIQSFLNILSESSVGFLPTEDTSIIAKALRIFNLN